MTALLWASKNGHLPVVRELVDDYRVNVFQQNKVYISSCTIVLPPHTHTHTHTRTHTHTHTHMHIHTLSCGIQLYCSGFRTRKGSHISEQFIQLSGNRSCHVCGTTCNITRKYKQEQTQRYV